MSKKQQEKEVDLGSASSVKSGSPTPAPGAVPPSKESVLEWVRKDLQSAHYLLGVILHRHPEIVSEIGETVYETVMRKESGPAINHEANATAE